MFACVLEDRWGSEKGYVGSVVEEREKPYSVRIRDDDCDFECPGSLEPHVKEAGDE